MTGGSSTSRRPPSRLPSRWPLALLLLLPPSREQCGIGGGRERGGRQRHPPTHPPPKPAPGVWGHPKVVPFNWGEWWHPGHSCPGCGPGKEVPLSFGKQWERRPPFSPFPHLAKLRHGLSPPLLLLLLEALGRLPSPARGPTRRRKGPSRAGMVGCIQEGEGCCGTPRSGDSQIPPGSVPSSQDRE